jgi:hypothetical protein
LLVPISLILPFAQRKKEVKPGTTKEAGELEKDEHSELLDGVAKAETAVEKSSTDEELMETVQLKSCHRKRGFLGNALELMEVGQFGIRSSIQTQFLARFLRPLPEQARLPLVPMVGAAPMRNIPGEPFLPLAEPDQKTE